MVTINGVDDDGDGDGDGNKSPKLGGRGYFVRGGDRRDDRCVSGSAAVGGET